MFLPQHALDPSVGVLDTYKAPSVAGRYKGLTQLYTIIIPSSQYGQNVILYRFYSKRAKLICTTEFWFNRVYRFID